MTVAAAFPTVITAVLTTAQAATPERVVRGRDIVSSDPDHDAVMIGVARLDDSPGWDSAGSFTQEFQTFGGNRLETGTVNCLVLAWNGDSDQDAATTAAFAIFADIAAAIRATPTLGITTFDYMVAQVTSSDVTEAQNDDGANTVLPFVVSYEARI